MRHHAQPVGPRRDAIRAGQARGTEYSGQTREAAPLFDQLQQGTAARALRQFRIGQSLRRRIIPEHRITQRLQFGVRDAIEFHPKLENGHGHQLSGLPGAAADKDCAAILEACENRMQSFV